MTFVKPTCSWTVPTTVTQTFNNITTGFNNGLPNGPMCATEAWGPIVITEPPQFNPNGSVNGSGTGCIVQCASPQRDYLRNTSISYASEINKIQVEYADGSFGVLQSPSGLDQSFPYPYGYVENSDGSFTLINGDYAWIAMNSGYSSDTPTASYTLDYFDGGGNDWYRSTASDAFTTWVMYRPPAAGLGTIYVPLQVVSWQWAGVANKIAGIWTVTGGYQNQSSWSSTGASDTTLFPFWTMSISTPLHFSN